LDAVSGTGRWWRHAAPPTWRLVVFHRLVPLALATGTLLVALSGCGTPAGPEQPGAPATARVASTAPSAGARAYVDAVNREDLDALVAAFSPDGEIVDVSRRIRGADAIRRWAGSEVIGGTLRVDSVTPLSPDTQRLRVHWAPAGSSGWAADYTFTTLDDRITTADLQYAR
jgi:hypothetical protein